MLVADQASSPSARSASTSTVIHSPRARSQRFRRSRMQLAGRKHALPVDHPLPRRLGGLRCDPLRAVGRRARFALRGTRRFVLHYFSGTTSRQRFTLRRPGFIISIHTSVTHPNAQAQMREVAAARAR